MSARDNRNLYGDLATDAVESLVEVDDYAVTELDLDDGPAPDREHLMTTSFRRKPGEDVVSLVDDEDYLIDSAGEASE